MPSIFDKIEDQKKRKTLKNIAVAEYETSRGVQHLAMLKGAKDKLKTSLLQCGRNIKNLSNDLENIHKTAQTLLRITLEKQLIKTHITEISGIGQSLGSTILRLVYKTSLRDLWNASAYNGIGQTKQYFINQWVAKYEREVPALLNQDFPGKSDIISEANAELSSLQSELIKWQTDQTREEEKLDRITKEINRLEMVTVDAFIKARIDHQGDLTKIDGFINGVFSEWEVMPEWFREVIQQNEEDNV